MNRLDKLTSGLIQLTELEYDVLNKYINFNRSIFFSDDGYYAICEPKTSGWNFKHNQYPIIKLSDLNILLKIKWDIVCKINELLNDYPEDVSLWDRLGDFTDSMELLVDTSINMNNPYYLQINLFIYDNI